MSNLVKDPKTNRTKQFRITNARVQYPALTEPRGDDDLKPGTYGAQLIIDDPETIALMKEYATEVAKEAVRTNWKKTPKNLTVPYAKGDDDRDAEAGKVILKTNSGFQPKLYIRRPGQRTIVLDDHEEYYAGMYVDADVVFKDYNVTGNYGVTAYLQAICKVADGEPFYASSAASFDVEDFEDDEASSFDVKPTAPKTATKEVVVSKKTKKPESLDLDLGDFELEDTLEDDASYLDEVSGMSIEDLLNQ